MTSFKERLRADRSKGAWFDQDRRYLLMRADTLMGMFHELPESARLAALEAFGRSVVKYGGDSARAYMAMGGTGKELLQLIANTAPDLGWGVWQIENDGRAVVVANSPFAAGFGPANHPVCHGLKGMLQAVAPHAMGGPVDVAEVSCAAMGAQACTFQIALEPKA